MSLAFACLSSPLSELWSDHIPSGRCILTSGHVPCGRYPDDAGYLFPYDPIVFTMLETGRGSYPIYSVPFYTLHKVRAPLLWRPVALLNPIHARVQRWHGTILCVVVHLAWRQCTWWTFSSCPIPSSHLRLVDRSIDCVFSSTFNALNLLCT